MRDNHMNYPHATDFKKVRVRGERDLDGKRLYVRAGRGMHHAIAMEVKGRGLSAKGSSASA